MDDTPTLKNWEELVALFRGMCFLRHQGNTAASDEILHRQLPARIASWSESCQRDPNAKKAQLSDMFAQERRRVEDAYTLHEMTAIHWREELLPALARTLCQEVKATLREQFAAQSAQRASVERTAGMPGAVYRPKVAFDDIPAVIDLIMAEEQREEILREQAMA